jgi:hypothetical protein
MSFCQKKLILQNKDTCMVNGHIVCNLTSSLPTQHYIYEIDLDEFSISLNILENQINA